MKIYLNEWMRDTDRLARQSYRKGTRAFVLSKELRKAISIIRLLGHTIQGKDAQDTLPKVEEIINSSEVTHEG